jgi:4-hydroxy-L-threonine phosphate dehydrogenase PdxA
LGDPSGVGPEVAYLAAIAPEVRRVCRPLLIGDEQIVRRTQEALNHPAPWKPSTK